MKRQENTLSKDPNNYLVHNDVEPTQNLTTKTQSHIHRDNFTQQGVNHSTGKTPSHKKVLSRKSVLPFSLFFTSILHFLPIFIFIGLATMADPSFTAVTMYHKHSHKAPSTDRGPYPPGQPKLWAGNPRPPSHCANLRTALQQPRSAGHGRIFMFTI